MKKFLIGLVIVLVVAIVGGAYYLGSNKKENNSGLKKYVDNSLGFEYPDSLILVVKNGDKVSLNHSIDYKHGDFCDQRNGGGTALDKFTDFDVSLRVVNKNIKETLDETMGSLAKDYFANGTFKLSPGFIDNFEVGSLKGYQVTSGVEGCGVYTYYFPITSAKTLIVTRSFIPEFNSINADNKTYLNLPGVILPNQEVEFFTKILASLKVK